MSSKSKVERRKFADRQTARELLQDLVAGNADAYLTYRRLYLMWCANNAALQELRPLFRMEGIDPDGRLSVTTEFREKVLSTARTILPQLSH